jgi:MinD-like ATPase involved in chromosome partitioning or flagellar assembly
MAADYDRLFALPDGAETPAPAHDNPNGFDVTPQVPPPAVRHGRHARHRAEPPTPPPPGQRARPRPSAPPPRSTEATVKIRRRAPVTPDGPAAAATDKPTVKLVPRRGWRRWVHAVTRLNPGLSRDERYEIDLQTRIRRNPHGCYQIGVLGLKGGAGRTAVTVALGSVLAQVRGDRVLAIDADTAAGNLADRVGRQSEATIADLLAAKVVSRYPDIREYTSVNAAKLEVLPAQEYSAARRALSDADWYFTAGAVSKFYNVVLADCGISLFDPATSGVLSTVSGVVIVASASTDGVQQAGVAIDWLNRKGYQELLSRGCVVINHVVPGESNVAVRDVKRRFEKHVQPERVVELPWDKHIAAGTDIRLGLLGAIYQRRILELAAAVSDGFDRSVVR